MTGTCLTATAWLIRAERRVPRFPMRGSLSAPVARPLRPSSATTTCTATSRAKQMTSPCSMNSTRAHVQVQYGTVLRCALCERTNGRLPSSEWYKHNAILYRLRTRKPYKPCCRCRCSKVASAIHVETPTELLLYGADFRLHAPLQAHGNLPIQSGFATCSRPASSSTGTCTEHPLLHHIRYVPRTGYIFWHSRIPGPSLAGLQGQLAFPNHKCSLQIVRRATGDSKPTACRSDPNVASHGRSKCRSMLPIAPHSSGTRRIMCPGSHILAELTLYCTVLALETSRTKAQVVICPKPGQLSSLLFRGIPLLRSQAKRSSSSTNSANGVKRR